LRLQVLDAVKDVDEARPFLAPITSDLAADYADVIKQPMDLSTIEIKLLEREYSHISQLIDDVNLMLNNCLTYNGEYSGRC
jgi:histone acetyltransferase